MATIKIVDPVTRIEGHLKVEVTIDDVGGVQQVIDAQCSGTQFRGFETILQGRDPLDAPNLTQRICGVCPVSHGMASTMALEDAAEYAIPTNARILRNLVLGANYIASHILHFYLLSSLDYVTPPGSTPWIPYWNVDMMRDPIALQPIPGNFVEAVAKRREAQEMAAIFGGRMPMPPAFQAGGFTAKPTTEMINSFSAYLGSLKSFIDNNYVPDAELLQSVYPEYSTIGKGTGNLLSYGVFDLDDTADPDRLLERGYAFDSMPTNIQTVSVDNITEHVAYSWYADSTNNQNPAHGSTVTVDPAIKTNAYSWLKAPRYHGKPMEVGPLARMWVNGDYNNGISVMDRHLARAYETQMVANAMVIWLTEVTPGGDVFNLPLYENPYSASGAGLTEAPRGALGHWLATTIDGSSPLYGPAIDNYQVITPTCWNASPKDTRGNRGPIERALIGTEIIDPEKPIEVLRVIHSFDPCLACAVHVMRPEGKPVVIVNAGMRP